MSTDSNISRSLIHLALITGLLLMIPLIANPFIEGEGWTLSDFIIAGVLIFGTGLSYILVTRLLAPQVRDSIMYRIAVGFSLFTGLFLIWVNLAVGIIGSEDNEINLLYFGVIAVGVMGAFIARFLPLGMSYVMFAMAITQASVTMFALFTGIHQSPDIPLYHMLGVNGFFIMLFVVAGMLFRYAQEQLAETDMAEN